MEKKYFKQDFWRTKWYLHSAWQTTGWEEAKSEFYWSCRKMSARDLFVHITKTLTQSLCTEPFHIKYSKPSVTVFATLYSVSDVLKIYLFPTLVKSHTIYNTTSDLVWWKSFDWTSPWMLLSFDCVYTTYISWRIFPQFFFLRTILHFSNIHYHEGLIESFHICFFLKSIFHV